MATKKCTKILATDKTRPEKLKIPQIITKDKCSILKEGSQNNI